ncbi:hypothetical protein BKA60DRAFT_464454 [Fusarium oxysporum]|nr:hypothetical protein BKA60DRAFT_464454 [Fusarium oxysporum]
MTDPDNLTCRYCRRSFSREEHVQRHVRKHLGLRPYSCAVCSRQFARRDILKRHLNTHGLSTDQVQAFSISSLGHIPHACANCAKSKQKCDRASPCGRCRQRKLQCETPPDSHWGRPEPENVAPSQNPTPSSGLQTSDIIMDSPEAPRTHYLGLHADSNDGTTESESQVMPGGCRVSHTDHTAQRRAATEAELSAVTDDPANSWFYPFSILDDTEEWLPRLSPWEYSVDPRLDTPPCLSTVTPTTPYGMVGRCGRASSQRPIYFPKLLLSDVDIIAAENYYHVPALSEETYQRMRLFFCSLHNTSSYSSEAQEFPDIDVLNSFMQLYFEYVNAQFPVLHLPTFQPSPKSWMLVLAVVAVGCSHSAIRNQHEFAVPLRDLLHQALVVKLLEGHCIDGDLVFGQTVLLHQLLMVFSGTTRASLKSQSMKSILVTVFQPFNSGDGSLFHRTRTPSSAEGSWAEWVEHESWNRLMYFTCYIECLQYVIWELSPVISSQDIRSPIPGDEARWGSATADQWDQETQRLHDSPSNFPLFDLLNKSTTVQETIERLQGSARLVAMTSVYVEEKRLLEERHSWLFCGLQSSAVGQGQQSTRTSTSDQLMRRQLDQKFELFEGQRDPYANTIPLALTHLKTYHLLSLLRRVPLRFLYMYFGWMTTRRGTQTAKEELSRVIMKDNQGARGALRHSAILFRIIRTQTTTTFFDPHSLLIASLYIRVYVELEDTLSKEISSNVGPSSSIGRPLRIDQDVEADSLHQWIRLGTRVPLHIAGVGILDGVESGTRVLKEAIRILERRTEWKVLNISMIKVLQQVIDGIPPTIDA